MEERVGVKCVKEMEWINSWLVGWQRVYFSPSLLSHSVCDQVLFLVAVGAICAQGATINTLKRQKRTLGVLSTAAGIIFMKWSAFISIQWRRLFYLSFDSKQFVSNYMFTSKQREDVNWQLFMCIQAVKMLGINPNLKSHKTFQYISEYLYV